jgi:hypothetical protein
MSPLDPRRTTRRVVRRAHRPLWTAGAAGALCIKPLREGGSAGVARIGSPFDLALYSEALRESLPALPANSLELPHPEIAFPNPPPAHLLVEPFIPTDRLDGVAARALTCQHAPCSTDMCSLASREFAVPIVFLACPLRCRGLVSVGFGCLVLDAAATWWVQPGGGGRGRRSGRRGRGGRRRRHRGGGGGLAARGEAAAPGEGPRPVRGDGGVVGRQQMDRGGCVLGGPARQHARSAAQHPRAELRRRPIRARQDARERPRLRLSVRPSDRLSLPVCLSALDKMHVSVRVCTCPSVRPSVCACLSVYLSVCLSVCLFATASRGALRAARDDVFALGHRPHLVCLGTVRMPPNVICMCLPNSTPSHPVTHGCPSSRWQAVDT